MSASAMKFATDVALAMLDSWYVTYEAYRAHRHGDMRRQAIKSKCCGIVYHDRTLIGAEALING